MSNSSDLWAAGPPSGNPYETRSGSLIACYVVTLLIAGAAVGARLYTRGRIQHVLGSEDWTVLVAWVGHPSPPCHWLG